MNNLLTHTLRWHGRAAVEPVYGTGVVVQETVPRGAPTPVISALWFPGSGYEIQVSAATVDVASRRTLSDTAKQSIRRKALKRRLAKDAPLFADALYSSALDDKPDYYGPTKKQP